MSRIMAAVGVLRTFSRMTKEDFDEMDHKLFRIAAGVVSFTVMALFWLFFLKNIVPF